MQLYFCPLNIFLSSLKAKLQRAVSVTIDFLILESFTLFLPCSVLEVTAVKYSVLISYSSSYFQEIHELLATWRPYFDASSCIFVHAPSKNRQLLFEGEKLPSGTLDSVVRHIPITVRRPTFKEAKRIYSILTHVSEEGNEKKCPPILERATPEIEVEKTGQEAREESSIMNPDKSEPIISEAHQRPESSGSESLPIYREADKSVPEGGTPLHEAAKSGDEQRTLELLEQGLDPCVRDSRGRTPYMLASEKEVRNTFRRFMALNLDKWDWHSAGVPSPLTKEMEESQAAKQVRRALICSFLVHWDVSRI